MVHLLSYVDWLSVVQAFQENFKAAVLAAERSLLFTLGFNFSLTLPQKCLLHPVQGIATVLNLPIEQACASAAPNRDLQKANVQQAAWDICNERYTASPCKLKQHKCLCQPLWVQFVAV